MLKNLEGYLEKKKTFISKFTQMEECNVEEMIFESNYWSLETFYIINANSDFNCLER